MPASDSVRNILVVADPPHSYNPSSDTTYLMITEAQRRGHRVYWAGLEHLYIENEVAYAHAAQLNLPDSNSNFLATHPDCTKAGLPMSHFSVVLMRKDPPVDTDYITATWCLDRAAKQSWVINDPQGLRDLNEKLAILDFPDLIPPTRLLRHYSDLHRTLEDFGGEMIVKPLWGYGGREIFHVRSEDRNLSPTFEVATADESKWTMAQAFVPDAKDGDKRILLVDGEAVGAVLRVASKKDFRNNFHTGGHAVQAELTDQDLEICRRVAPFLKERGQFFAGLDVIGGKLTEINLTSPTGMQEINRLNSLDGENTMQARFWQAIETRWASAT